MNKSFIKVLGLLLVVGLLFAALPTGQAQAATYTVCPDGSCTYTTIQAAIDASVDGTTITVAPETFAGFSVVGRSNLTITGAGDASTIIAPTTLITTGVGHKYTPNMLASVFVNNSTGIKIEGMAIKSTTATPGSGGADAIVFWNNSTGSIEESIVQGLYAITGAQTGQGIAVDGGTSVLSLVNTDISGFSKNGVDIVDGNGGTTVPGTLTVNVTGGLITGAGPTAAVAQNGISFYNRAGGVLGGLVTGATIAGFDYTPTTNEATGILAFGLGGGTLAISGNTFSNNEASVYDNTGTLDMAAIVAANNFGSPVIVYDASGVKGGFTTIQAAIDAATAGDVITVAAGTYVEDLVIDKSVTLLGPNATVNPNTGTRVAEAILLPAVSAPDPAVCELMTEIKANNVTIKGFAFDGDNPALTSGILIGSADVDACEIIAQSIGLGGIVIENNLLKNATYSAIDMYNYTSDAATSGNYIRYNKIQNIGTTTYGWGMGIIIYNNFYADITDNVLENVRLGVQTGNYHRANVGTTGSISNNVINTWRLGIFHNLWYSAASPITISNNTINAVAHEGTTKWNGMVVSSFDGAANAIVSGNIISIPETVSFAAPGYATGYNIWNDHTTAPLVISGGSVTGGDYGVFVNNYEGYSSDADSTAVTIDGITLTGAEIGVYVKDSPSNTNNAIVTAIIKNNVITATTGIKVEGADATATGDHNKVYATTDVENTNPASMNFENNYWDSPCGATVVGVVDTIPWFEDAAMTVSKDTNPAGDLTLTPGMTALEINNIIACAAPYSTINFTIIPEDAEYPGGIIVPQGRDRLTLVLKDGARINANSPCFTVGADYTTIKAQNIGMASCITVAGSNGIDVAAGLRNLTVDGLEITGAGTDGIHFNGVISDVVLKDNFIHGLAGNGVFFGGQPIALTPGGIDIHGNMFQNNTGKGIEADTFTVPAEYNSWGDVLGANAGVGDGASTGVDADPWTHVDVYMVASGTPWTGIPLNQVVTGQTITFKVMAHVVNALTVDVKLVYPTNLINANPVLTGTAFSAFAKFDAHAPANTIWFHGMAPAVGTPPNVTYPPITGTVELFTVTFTGGTTGLNLPMDLDETSDVFGMEGHGSSTNIYAVALLDSTVNVIALPIIDIDPVISGPYTAGIPIDFNILVSNEHGGNFDNLQLDFGTLPAGAVLEYCTAGNPCTAWAPVTDPMTIGDLLSMGSEFDPVLPLFRITYVTPVTHVLTVDLVDLSPIVPPVDSTILASTTETFVTAANLSVTGTFSMQGRATRAGIPVTLTFQSTFAFGPLSAPTFDQISYNLRINGVIGGNWLLTTLQPRYLNVIADNNKLVTVDGDEILIALELKGGDANDDNQISVGDASIVGGAYGTGTITSQGDVNFDNKVNVQDLALVGGNYGLTSQTAYGVGNANIWTVQ